MEVRLYVPGKIKYNFKTVGKTIKITKFEIVRLYCVLCAHIIALTH